VEVTLQQTDPDAQRMLAFRAGDDAAFDGLFERWAGPLLRYLERMVGDPATAEDLVQETFFRVHRARGRYEARARFSTWLYRIATNLALNEMKKPRRRHFHDEGQEAELRSLASAPDEEAHARRTRPADRGRTRTRTRSAARTPARRALVDGGRRSLLCGGGRDPRDQRKVREGIGASGAGGAGGQDQSGQ